MQIIMDYGAAGDVRAQHQKSSAPSIRRASVPVRLKKGKLVSRFVAMPFWKVPEAHA